MQGIFLGAHVCENAHIQTHSLIRTSSDIRLNYLDGLSCFGGLVLQNNYPESPRRRGFRSADPKCPVQTACGRGLRCGCKVFVTRTLRTPADEKCQESDLRKADSDPSILSLGSNHIEYKPIFDVLRIKDVRAECPPGAICVVESRGSLTRAILGPYLPTSLIAAAFLSHEVMRCLGKMR
jgi:hypothetical protein